MWTLVDLTAPQLLKIHTFWTLNMHAVLSRFCQFLRQLRTACSYLCVFKFFSFQYVLFCPTPPIFIYIQPCVVQTLLLWTMDRRLLYSLQKKYTLFVVHIFWKMGIWDFVREITGNSLHINHSVRHCFWHWI